MEFLSDPHLFLHIGALVSVAALALRNQLKLRIVLSVSILINALYHFVQVPNPAWHDLFWNCVTFTINLIVTIQLIIDRTHLGLSEEDERLFALFGILTPGEYRKLVKLGRWHTTDVAVSLTREGAVPDYLYFVIEGPLHLTKHGRSQAIQAPTFIGEIAFLRGSPASATVSVEPGARFLAWSAPVLHAHLARKQAFRVAVLRLLGADLAAKLARS